MMRGNVYQLSIQMYGCRVVQRALQYSDASTRDELIAEIKAQLTKIVEDQNGNHVIQKVIELVRNSPSCSWRFTVFIVLAFQYENDEEQLQFLVNNLKENVYKIATHPYGCRVIQKLIQNCSDGQVRLVPYPLPQALIIVPCRGRNGNFWTP